MIKQDINLRYMTSIFYIMTGVQFTITNYHSPSTVDYTGWSAVVSSWLLAQWLILRGIYDCIWAYTVITYILL